ncbi:dihydrolipoyl dehydrogenase [Bordetella pertussis]|uniref:dihydrolipoyl dehydrogenase n=1 Tax=Bordetella pertussis TaxID=520 RepID=UPI0005E37C39|nr:dihydrolipoyl dehydrogenase [Bordetella pertussis]CFN22285.1 dihydrolipoamide dehydrogenase [Bordetella pertussis]CFN66733.1 dihydrolipoamide dehydrogenase [Bordetella pertussis]CPL39953.1 dihydrolipoamide dehydrogenase [Bordetella pertussis]
MASTMETDLLVLGGGPGGYTAAFRAADLGLSVVLVEQRPTLGGVCLNVGCIPSKALLHCAKALDEARAMSELGIEFSEPRIRLDKLRAHKEALVAKLCGGLGGLARQRKVEVVTGTGRFDGPHSLAVSDGSRVAFKQAVIAVGSRPVRLPFLPDDPRIMDSTGALELKEIPRRLLVIGGGVIGMELATVYAALSARVTVVELTDGLLPGCDRDLVKPLAQRVASRYEAVLLGTRVSAAQARDDGIHVSFDGPQAPGPQVYDQVLVAAGRRPNGAAIDAERAGARVDEGGFIRVDAQQRTNVGHIYAIGDVVGEPMLAHKAAHEGKVAAETAAGMRVANDARVIPAVAYTDPEVAWVGLTETAAQRDGIAYEKAAFPWAASGRALSLGRGEGLTKILVDPATHALLGVGMVGPQAGDLIAEAALAIEMGAEPGDIALTIHPHPTLSETLAFAAEAYEGTLTELYLTRKKS